MNDWGRGHSRILEKLRSHDEESCGCPSGRGITHPSLRVIAGGGDELVDLLLTDPQRKGPVLPTLELKDG
jgi:hypothetical protein